MPVKTPAVGKDVDAFCTRCKMVLNHVVVAKVADTIKRVKCLTCGSEHNFKAAEKPASLRSATPKSKAGAVSTTIRASDYDLLMKGRDLSRARKYKPTLTFAQNEVVDHPSFGMGIVVKEKDNTKIDVAFRDGLKTLIHKLA